MTWWQWLFSSEGLMPQGIGGLWSPGMFLLYLASDSLIWAAYLAIPLVLFSFAHSRRASLRFPRLFWLFGLFVLACGSTHFMDIMLLYLPLYPVAGVIKLATALLSWGTVIALMRVTPLARHLRSPRELEREIEERRQAEAELRAAHDGLEEQVREHAEELHQARAELLASDEQFQMMANSIPQLAWVADADGNVFWFNRRWHDYTGTTPEQMEGPNRRSMHDPALLPSILERYQQAIAAGQPFEMEIPLRRADGDFRTFLTRAEPMKDASGRIVRWFGTNTDIEDQKRAQQQLATSLSLLHATIESTADCIIALDLAGNIIEYNSKFNAMWRYSAELLQRDNSAELRAFAANQTTDPDRFIQIFRDHLAAPEVETYDVIELKDGRTIERYGFPQRVDGVCVGIVANLRDITERRRAEAEREELLAKEHAAREEAERAHEAKSELLSRMSHELRTPLNAILGFAQLLAAAEKRLMPRDNECVQHILKAGRQQLQLVNEVLDITSLDVVNSAMVLEPIALQEVAREALDMLGSMAATSDISISEELSATPATYVLSDRQWLLQVMLNLISNAIKYNRQGGRITLRVEVSPTASTGTGRARFHITDTGHGIAEADLPKLFVPFSRLNAEELGIEGTGLGLALCKRLVEAMSGGLFVESHVGQGSTFSLELPLAEIPVALENAGDPAAASAPPPKHTALLIEDNLLNYQLVEALLERFSDIHLIGAMQGSLGVELAREQRPDLILLDLHLPDIMGDEVLNRLQAMPETRNIPVIMISSDSEFSQIARLRAQGIRDYLVKPFDIKKFLQSVDEIIRTLEPDPNSPHE